MIAARLFHCNGIEGFQHRTRLSSSPDEKVRTLRTSLVPGLKDNPRRPPEFPEIRPMLLQKSHDSPGLRLIDLDHDSRRLIWETRLLSVSMSALTSLGDNFRQSAPARKKDTIGKALVLWSQSTD